MAADVLAWLARRAEPIPATLQGRLAEALRELGAPAAPRPVHETLLVAGEAMLARLLNHNRTTREAALDLLTADALVTYAFEAAAEAGVPVAERAHRAMLQIAALGA